MIVMSAQNTVMTAIRAAEVGAYEYLPKPFDLKEVLGQVAKALNHRSLPPRCRGGAAREDNLPLIGRSPAMQEVYRILARLMNTDLGVMITGEAAPARSWWRGRCTTTACARPGRSWRSTWRRSRGT